MVLRNLVRWKENAGLLKWKWLYALIEGKSPTVLGVIGDWAKTLSHRYRPQIMARLGNSVGQRPQWGGKPPFGDISSRCKSQLRGDVRHCNWPCKWRAIVACLVASAFPFRMMDSLWGHFSCSFYISSVENWRIAWMVEWWCWCQ